MAVSIDRSRLDSALTVIGDALAVARGADSVVLTGTADPTPTPPATSTVPQNFRAVANSNNTVTLAADPVAGATEYRIYEGTPDNLLTTRTEPTRTSGLLRRDAYVYWMTAVVDGVESDLSAPANVTVGEPVPPTDTDPEPTTPTPPPPPVTIPQNLVATVTPENKVFLNWDDVAGFDSARGDRYKVYASSSGLSGTMTVSERLSGVLSPGTRDYTVRTLFNGVEGEPSEPVTVVVPSQPAPAPVVTAPKSTLRHPAPSGYESWPAISVADVGRVVRVAANTSRRIVLPSTPFDVRGGLVIHVGENAKAVLVGGEITHSVKYSSAYDGRGIQINLGTKSLLHIEGVRISGYISEAIDVNNCGLGAELRTSRMLVGTRERPVYNHPGIHSDILQTWDGPYKWQIEDFTGYGTEQGIMLDPGEYAAGKVKDSSGEVTAYAEPWHMLMRNMQMVFPNGGGVVIYRSGRGKEPLVSSHPEYVAGKTALQLSKITVENCWYTHSSRSFGSAFVSGYAGANGSRNPGDDFDAWRDGFNESIARTTANTGLNYKGV